MKKHLSVFIHVQKIIFFLLVLSFIIIKCENKQRQHNYPNWKLRYPQGSTMGMFLAAAIPLYLPRNSAYLTFNWEANYVLPHNETEYTYPPIIRRQIDRKLVYNAVETKLQLQHYPGRACLLRIICEASANTLLENNGVLGHILHIFLTPSTSTNQGLSREYRRAEEHGRNNENCNKYHKKCTVSFLDLISWLGHIV